VGDGGFHDFGGLEDEGELHLAAAEEFAYDFHAGEEVVVDDVQGLVFLPGFFEVFDEFLLIAVDDMALKFLLDGQVLGFGGGGSLFVAEGGEEVERVVVLRSEF
jgi:hypothetical protein